MQQKSLIESLENNNLEAWDKVLELFGEEAPNYDHGDLEAFSNLCPYLAADSSVPLVDILPEALATALYLIGLEYEHKRDFSARLPQLLRDVGVAEGACPSIQYGQVLVAVCFCLPAVFQALPSDSGREIWTALLETRTLLGRAPNSNAGLALRAARFLHLFIILSTDQRAHENHLRQYRLKEESEVTMEILLSFVYSPNVQSAVLLGLISLLGHLANERPSFLSKIVPCLIDLFESPPTHLTVPQNQFLMHSLGKQLSSLMENPEAQIYYSLLVEILRKQPPKPSAQSQALNKRKLPSSTSQSSGQGEKKDEEEEDDAILANVGSKKMKMDSILIDVAQYPLNVAIEVVLHFLRQTSQTTLGEALEKWRPTGGVVLRDPRRKSGMGASRPAPSESANIDQKETPSDGPFELKPSAYDLNEGSKFMIWQFKNLLQNLATDTNGLSSSSSNSKFIGIAKKKKSRMQALMRLAGLIGSMERDQDGHGAIFPLLSEVLVDFCFDNLSERIGLLIYWLRLLWIKNASSATAVSSAENAYELAYSHCVGKFQQLLEDALLPDWEVNLQKFLLDAPDLIPNYHEALLDQVCRNAENRILGLVVFEQVLLNRPALKGGLLALILSYCYDPSDEPLRRSAVLIVADSLSKKSEFADDILMYVKDNLQMIKNLHPFTEDEAPRPICGAFLDLPLRLLFKNPSRYSYLISSLLGPMVAPSGTAEVDASNDEDQMSLDAHCLEYFSGHFPTLLPLLEDETNFRAFWAAMVRINVLAITEDAIGIFKSILEFISKRSLIDGEGALLAARQIETGHWPAFFFEFIAPHLSDSEVIQSCLAKYLDAFDPGADANRIAIATLFSRLSERLGPVEFFILIHRLEGLVPLKRVIDATQICFSMTVVFKAETLSAALTKLVDETPLPTLIMRSIMQSLTLYRNLSSTIAGNLMTKLVSKNIWEFPRLWEGFVRVLKPVINVLLSGRPVCLDATAANLLHNAPIASGPARICPRDGSRFEEALCELCQ